MKLLAFLCAIASSCAYSEESRMRAWQPGLPEDGVVAVSQVGQGKVTRQLFSDCWAAFREQYYVDSAGAFKPHNVTLEALRTVGSLNYLEYVNDQERLGRQNPYRRKLQIFGNADAAGLPIDGYYMVKHYQPSIEQEVGDRRFPVAKETRILGWRFFVANPAVARTGVIEVMAERYDSGDYRELAPMADTKKLQESFIESLKAGSIFKVIIQRHVVCPYGAWGAGWRKCDICKGQGGREFPHLMTLKW